MKTLDDSAEVVVIVAGRLGSLGMKWGEARERYVRILGPDAVEACPIDLVLRGEWFGKTDGETVLTVRLARAVRRDAISPSSGVHYTLPG